MHIFFSDEFKKHFKKLPNKVQTQFAKRIDLFIENPNHPLLKVHPLKGNLVGYRSFSVAGDYRVIYRIVNSGSIKLIDIGTHNQVY